MGRVLRDLTKRLLASVGSGPLGAPVAILLGSLGRWRLLPAALATAAVAQAWSRRRDRTIHVTRSLGGRRHVRLQLDLSYSGCLELLIAPRPGAGDVHTSALLMALVRDADLFVDVGANVGLYTYLAAAAAPGLPVISVEPVPALAAIVGKNVLRNRWDPRVAVRAQAIGTARGTSTMYVLDAADTEHTLDAARLQGREWRAVPVPVVAIDDLLTGDGVRGSRVVLKIDVEGQEAEALAGMERTLAAPDRPDIVMEFLGRAIEQGGIVERVLASGMDIYYIGPAGLTRLGRSSDLGPVHTLGYWNFFLTARPASEVSALAASAGVALTDGLVRSPTSGLMPPCSHRLESSPRGGS